MMSQQSPMSLICCFCSNGESSPSQPLEVSGSENVKSDKYYLTSALPDGVLQQVEVNVNCNILAYSDVLFRIPTLWLCLFCLFVFFLSAEQWSSSLPLCSEFSQSRYKEVFLPNLHGVFPWTFRHGEPQEGSLRFQYLQVPWLWLYLQFLAWGQGISLKVLQ